ncbi:MAG: hypothetical protein NT022_11480 [Deltaproteobacteria bacterium]|nr:hypothetical protein [Deltaproteobacteria bacterium]
MAEEWKGGNASVGDAMKASAAAHAVARESSDPTAIAVARSVGHAVATAHMADHSLGAALYALKAVKYAAQSPDAERRWQDEQLPPEIKDFILTARKSRKILKKKEIDFFTKILTAHRLFPGPPHAGPLLNLGVYGHLKPLSVRDSVLRQPLKSKKSLEVSSSF